MDQGPVFEDFVIKNVYKWPYLILHRHRKMAPQSPPKHFYSTRQLKETGMTASRSGTSFATLEPLTNSVTTVMYGGTPVILPSPAQEYHTMIDNVV